jgi:hypothetical protein
VSVFWDSAQTEPFIVWAGEASEQHPPVTGIVSTRGITIFLVPKEADTTSQRSCERSNHRIEFE